MMPRDAWSTAQAPMFISGPSGHVPTDPGGEGHRGRHTGRAGSRLPQKAGGSVQVITGLQGRQQTRNTRRNAKA